MGRKFRDIVGSRFYCDLVLNQQAFGEFCSRLPSLTCFKQSDTRGIYCGSNRFVLDLAEPSVFPSFLRNGYHRAAFAQPFYELYCECGNFLEIEWDEILSNVKESLLPTVLVLSVLLKIDEEYTSLAFTVFFEKDPEKQRKVDLSFWVQSYSAFGNPLEVLTVYPTKMEGLAKKDHQRTPLRIQRVMDVLGLASSFTLDMQTEGSNEVRFSSQEPTRAFDLIQGLLGSRIQDFDPHFYLQITGPTATKNLRWNTDQIAKRFGIKDNVISIDLNDLIVEDKNYDPAYYEWLAGLFNQRTPSGKAAYFPLGTFEGPRSNTFEIAAYIHPSGSVLSCVSDGNARSIPEELIAFSPAEWSRGKLPDRSYPHPVNHFFGEGEEVIPPSSKAKSTNKKKGDAVRSTTKATKGSAVPTIEHPIGSLEWHMDALARVGVSLSESVTIESFRKLVDPKKLEARSFQELLTLLGMHVNGDSNQPCYSDNVWFVDGSCTMKGTSYAEIIDNLQRISGRQLAIGTVIELGDEEEDEREIEEWLGPRWIQFDLAGIDVTWELSDPSGWLDSAVFDHFNGLLQAAGSGLKIHCFDLDNGGVTLVCATEEHGMQLRELIFGEAS